MKPFYFNDNGNCCNDWNNKIFQNLDHKFSTKLAAKSMLIGAQ